MKLRTKKQIRQITAMLLLLMAAIAFAACRGTDSPETDADVDEAITTESNEDMESYDDDEEYDDEHGPDDEIVFPDEDLGDLVEVEKDGKFGALNKKGEQVVPYEYDDIEWVGSDRYLLGRTDGQEGIVNSKNEEIVAFGKYEFTIGSYNDYIWGDEWIDRIAAKDCETGKCGYYSVVDNSWAIEPKFNEAAPFDGPITAVKDQNDRWGFINEDGEFVIQPKYKEVDLDSYYGFSYDSDAVKAVAEDGRTVFVLKSGKEYDAPTLKEGYEVIDFQYGCFRVCHNENYGVADKGGKAIIPAKYFLDEITISKNEIAVRKWSQAREEAEWIVYDHKGKKTGRQYTDDECYEMSMGHRLPQGDFIDIVYVDSDPDSGDTSEEDVAFAALKNGGSGYRLFNKNGKKLGETEYDNVYSFADYPERVYISAFEKNGKIGFMNRKGETLLKPTFPAHEEGELQYDPGFRNEDFGIVPDQKTDKYAVIDKDFNLITDYQFTDFGEANHGMLTVGEGKSCWVINTKGEEVLPSGKYKEIEMIFKNGLILVKDPSSEKYAFFNDEGKQVTEFKYEIEYAYC